MEHLMAKLGDEIHDVSEEVFDVFSHTQALHGLGMVQPELQQVEVTVAGHDYTITQSPGLLRSDRPGGTTGAAQWQTSLLFAEWLEWFCNPLFETEVLSSSSTVLELGSGLSGLVPCVLRSKVNRVVATDQEFLLKTLRENVAANSTVARTATGKHRSGARSRSQDYSTGRVDVFALDWETDDVRSTLSVNDLGDGVDCVIACDCIYNYALVDPFLQTCIDVASLHEQKQEGSKQPATPTVFLIAQQLRQPEVFEQWLEAFSQSFRVWRLPASMLNDGLKDNGGFIVHLAILQNRRGEDITR